MCALDDSRKGTQERRRGLEDKDKIMGYSISKVTYIHIYGIVKEIQF